MVDPREALLRGLSQGRSGQSGQLQMHLRIAKASPSVRRVLQTLLEGQPLTQSAAHILLSPQGLSGEDLDQDVLAIAAVADEYRFRQVGDGIGFEINRLIHYTNVCQVACRFCSFGKAAEDSGAYTLSLDEVLLRVQEARDRGATTVCLQGGVNSAFSLRIYRQWLRAIRQAFPTIHIQAFSPIELFGVSKSSGLSMPTVLAQLHEDGLCSVAGTSAENLQAALQHFLSPQGLSPAQWEEIMRQIHQEGLYSTASILHGHLDAPTHWVYHLFRLQRLQIQALEEPQQGHFLSFTPLAFIHGRTLLFRMYKGVRPGPAFADTVRIMAVARLVLGPYIPHLVASWPTTGPEIARVLLQCGANFLSGTTMSSAQGLSTGDPAQTLLTPQQLMDLVQPLVQAQGRSVFQSDAFHQALRFFPDQDVVMSPAWARALTPDPQAVRSAFATGASFKPDLITQIEFKMLDFFPARKKMPVHEAHSSCP